MRTSRSSLFGFARSRLTLTLVGSVSTDSARCIDRLRSLGCSMSSRKKALRLNRHAVKALLLAFAAVKVCTGCAMRRMTHVGGKRRPSFPVSVCPFSPDRPFQWARSVSLRSLSTALLRAEALQRDREVSQPEAIGNPLLECTSIRSTTTASTCLSCAFLLILDDAKRPPRSLGRYAEETRVP